MIHTGKCLCGKVRYRAENLKTGFSVCHCEMCRRWSGAPAFATTADALAIEGEENITRFSSSDWAERGFCKHCGSHLFYRLKDNDQYHLWVGTLDDQSGLQLAGEIFIDEKPAGYDFVGDHPRQTGAEVFAAFQQENP